MARVDIAHILIAHLAASEEVGSCKYTFDLIVLLAQTEPCPTFNWCHNKQYNNIRSSNNDNRH